MTRWYAEGGETCIALSRDGRLLEPLPTFGPESYRLIATSVELRDARSYALRHGFTHTREILPRRA